MGWQPGADGWTGGEPSPGLPGGREDPGSSAPERDRRLAGFTDGGEWDACAPSAALAAALDGASGPEWRCPGADRDEMVGLLRKWQSMEAWATAGKLGVLRALLREDDLELPGTPRHGDLPDEWSQSLTYEVAAALSMPTPSADKLISLAWSLQARLPGIGALLVEGRLTYAKAKAVDEALRLLSDEDAAAAEAMILPQLPGKTYGQVEKLAAAAAVTVDPESATRRREDAEQHRSRVTMFREQSGAAGLSGRDLPTDQTLAAHAKVCARAQEYKDSGVFPGTRMDQFRAAAYLDLLNGISAADRIASGELATGTHTGEDTDPADAWARGLDADGCDCSCAECDGGCLPPEDGDHGDDQPGPEDEGPNDEGPEGGPGNGGSPDPPRGPAQHDERPSRPGIPPRLTDLVIPLATLLGLSERPGEGHGLGVLDPSLCRDLAIRAAASPDSTLCVTVVDPDGIAIGHGCARGNRNEEASLTALPSRVNLTVTPALLTELAGCDPPGPPGPAGDPPWCRPWTFTLPGGAEIIVRLEPLPTFECDHRYESHGYQPSDKLRHLVQIRDYECTFPPCSRHARESDFEHALPYHKGGKTCGCNAGARSRQCHQVKQSPGWNVTQPRPGWHRWEAPSGRIYIQEAHRYSLLLSLRSSLPGTDDRLGPGHRTGLEGANAITTRLCRTWISSGTSGPPPRTRCMAAFRRASGFPGPSRDVCRLCRSAPWQGMESESGAIAVRQRLRPRERGEMTTYDVLNQAAIAATPAEIVSALLEEAAGRSRWWQPFLRISQRGDKPLPEIGAVVDLTVSVEGLPAGRLAAVHFCGRVSAFEPGRRLVLEYFAGDFRGTEEWTLDQVDTGHTRIATRWQTDPQGMVRLLARFVDVPGSYSRVMQEGFRGIERFTASRRAGSQA